MSRDRPACLSGGTSPVRRFTAPGAEQGPKSAVVRMATILPPCNRHATCRRLRRILIQDNDAVSAVCTKKDSIPVPFGPWRILRTAASPAAEPLVEYILVCRSGDETFKAPPCGWAIAFAIGNASPGRGRLAERERVRVTNRGARLRATFTRLRAVARNRPLPSRARKEAPPWSICARPPVGRHFSFPRLAAPAFDL